MKHSDRFKSASLAKALTVFWKLPSSTQFFRYRCAVWKATKRSSRGTSSQLAPVRITQRIVSSTLRASALGLPRFILRGGAAGDSGLILALWASVKGWNMNSSLAF